MYTTKRDPGAARNPWWPPTPEGDPTVCPRNTETRCTHECETYAGILRWPHALSSAWGRGGGPPENAS
eukprot:549998-Lingulodinium_polyedra.AAC.1